MATTEVLSNVIFFDIVIIVIIATTLAYFIKILRQPMLPAFILAGFLLGPGLASVFSHFGFDAIPIISDSAFITVLSTIGLTFLMFISGLEIDFRRLKEVGRVCLYGSFIQFVILASISAVIASLFFDWYSSFVIGLALTFSSTAIIIKVLSDSGEIDSLHGRIIVGTLLVGDVMGVIILGLITTSSTMSVSVVPLVFLKAAVLIGIAYLLSKHFLNNLFSIAARSGQLLFLTSIAICFLYGLLAMHIGNIILFVFQNPFWTIPLSATIVENMSTGFNLMIGAYIAGVSLGNLRYSSEIISRVIPLRDFFVLLFFVSLGLDITLYNLMAIWVPLILLLGFLIFIKPLVIAYVISKFGYEKKTSFISGLNLHPVDSEFGLILVLATVSNSEVVSLITILMVTTLILTSYFNKFEDAIYRRAEKYLNFLNIDPKFAQTLEYHPEDVKKEIVLVGCGRTGYHIINTLKKMEKNFLVVDFNPETIKHLIKQKIHCLYGNIGDIEIIKRLHLQDARFVICTVPGQRVNMLMTHQAKKHNPKCIVFVTAYNVNDAIDLYEAGADYVVLPHYLGGAHVSLLLEDIASDISTDIAKLLKHKNTHINELLDHKKVGWTR